MRERFPYFRSGRDSSVLFVDFNGIIANINLDLMNEIDYTKTGEQEVNITFTKKEKTYNASFKIIIEAEEE